MKRERKPALQDSLQCNRPSGLVGRRELVAAQDVPVTLVFVASTPLITRYLVIQRLFFNYPMSDTL